MSSSPFTVAVCIHYFTGLECSVHGNLLNFIVRFLFTEDAQMLIMGKHEVPVAIVSVTLPQATKRVPLTNFVAALPNCIPSQKDVLERLIYVEVATLVCIYTKNGRIFYLDFLIF